MLIVLVHLVLQPWYLPGQCFHMWSANTDIFWHLPGFWHLGAGVKATWTHHWSFFTCAHTESSSHICCWSNSQTLGGDFCPIPYVVLFHSEANYGRFVLELQSIHKGYSLRILRCSVKSAIPLVLPSVLMWYRMSTVLNYAQPTLHNNFFILALFSLHH